MERLYCIGILSLNGKKPTFISKYLLNANYSSDTITDILEDEELNINVGASYSFEYDGLKYLMHFISTSELICIVSTKEYKNRLLAKLVTEMKPQYEASVKSGKKSYTYLKTFGDKYNDPSTIDLITKTQSKINEVTSVMQQNIEMALINCVKLDELEIRAEELAQNAGIFKKKASDLKTKMWWKNIQMKIYIALIFLTIIGIITGILCAVYPPNKN